MARRSLPKTILALGRGGTWAAGMIGENLPDVALGKTDIRPDESISGRYPSSVGRAERTPDYLYAVYARGGNGGRPRRPRCYATTSTT